MMAGLARAESAPPKQIYLVHGEPEASEAFADRSREETGIRRAHPKYLEKVKI